MKRREFTSFIAVAAAWPLGARARAAMPVIGFLFDPPEVPPLLLAFRQGLAEAGYADGKNPSMWTSFSQQVPSWLPQPGMRQPASPSSQ
jgi:hypothetical protein